ncbi:hypothetical protein M3484_00105 [Pseudomonas sp. GX19020]|uniref:hypothetical protein n=1 Tax=Pseudomonas sp. GX19020 TaxID=2942277 RepID=UPI0020193E43|nr:hypothetical protein [Pseudomonas sp. GX19020]MCL4064979.1 hypothetical protein [Pseudomonas sp. GX19020]
MPAKSLLDLASSLEFSAATARMEHTAITMTAETAQQIASALFVAAGLLSQKQAPAVDGEGDKKAA